MSDPDRAPFIRLELSAHSTRFLEAELEVGTGSDAILDDGEREVVRIYESEGTLRVESLMLGIPTFLNDTPFNQGTSLQDGDVVQFGRSAGIVVNFTTEGLPPPTAATVEEPAGKSRSAVRLITATVAIASLLAFILAKSFDTEKSHSPATVAIPPVAAPPVAAPPVAAPPVAPPLEVPNMATPAPEAPTQSSVQLRAMEPEILQPRLPVPTPEEISPEPTPEWTVDLGAEIGCIVWNEITQTLLAGTGDGRLVEIDPGSGQISRTLTAHSSSVSAAAVSADGTYMATASYDHTIKVFRSFDDSSPVTLAAHVSQVRAIDIHPSEPLLASAGADGFVMLWDMASGKDITWMLGHIGMVNAVKFSPDGTRLFSAGSDGTIHVWDPATGEKINSFAGPQTGINALAWSPDGMRMVTAADGFLSSIDGIIMTPEQTLRIWDPVTTQEIEQSIDIEEWLLAAEFTSDGRYILVATGGHPARPGDAEIAPRSVVVDATNGTLLGARGGPLGPITDLVPHPDNRHYFISSTDQMLRRLIIPE